MPAMRALVGVAAAVVSARVHRTAQPCTRRTRAAGEEHLESTPPLDPRQLCIQQRSCRTVSVAIGSREQRTTRTSTLELLIAAKRTECGGQRALVPPRPPSLPCAGDIDPVIDIRAAPGGCRSPSFVLLGLEYNVHAKVNEEQSLVWRVAPHKSKKR